MVNVLIPLAVAGVAGAAVVYTMHSEHEHKRKMREQMRYHARPLTIPEKCNKLKHRCHQYIDLTSLDKHDVAAKRRFLELKLNDHIYRHIAPMLKFRAPQKHISKRCTAICEKVCDELHIHLKPRCEPPWGKYKTHQANFATNIFSLDYNHAPAITNIGLGGKRSLM